MIRVKIEAEAKLYIQEQIRIGKIELTWSYILEFENSLNPYPEKSKQILFWKEIAKDLILENSNIKLNSNKICNLGIKNKDSLHLACAIEAKCNYFITTDDKILIKTQSIEKIKVVDPVQFIKIIGD